MTIEEINYDVLIVGAGPSGLSAAIKLKQLASENSQDISVCVVEKASQVGGHTLSGAVIDVTSLTELLPNWKNANPPIVTPVTKDNFFYFTKKSALKIPNFLLPNTLSNKNHFVVSLSEVVKWMGEMAENLGVDIFTGYSAKNLLFDRKDNVIGIETGPFGILKNGKKSENYSPPIYLKAKFNLFAEGSRGHLGKKLIARFKLDSCSSPQSYSIGIKELWKVPENVSRPGEVWHGFGWPLNNRVYGGSFLYHMNNSQISLGLIVGLNYKNPWFSPFEEFQKLKNHPKINELLANGRRVGYGARTITGGGLFSLPKLYFPGGALIGCDAGFLNPAKIKGTHAAIKSGIIVAESIRTKLKEKNSTSLENYEEKFFNSSLFTELNKARNFKGFMNKGVFLGGVLFKIENLFLPNQSFLNLKNKKEDHLFLESAKKFKKIHYSKPDNKISFDRISSLPFSGTNHRDDQPTHLILSNKKTPLDVNLPRFQGPEIRYCPAAVYEYVSSTGQPTEDVSSAKELKINAQNCLHCKACDVKDPTQNINWITPEGGGGPNYEGM